MIMLAGSLGFLLKTVQHINCFLEFGDVNHSPGAALISNANLSGARSYCVERLRIAKSIVTNSKGEVLLTALRRGFAAASEARRKQGSAVLQQKAIIFTESRRTQDYLFRVLERTEFAGKTVLFNGSNTDSHSREVGNGGAVPDSLESGRVPASLVITARTSFGGNRKH